MLRGYRGIVVALAGLILIGAGEPPKQGARPGQGNASAPVAKQAQPAPLPAISTPAPAPPDPGCERGKDDRQSDLCAQWKAADSAKDAAHWAWLQLLAVPFGLIIGGGTLFFASRAAHWAKSAAVQTERSAKAAEDALHEVRITNARQLRPYVYFTSDGNNTEPVQSGSRIAFHYKNFGQLPAENLRFSFGFEIRERPIGYEQVPLFLDEYECVSLPPGDIREDSFSVDLSPTQLGRIASGGVMILRLRISYDIDANRRDFQEVEIATDGANMREGRFQNLTRHERERPT
jgi:hypothetical protein